MIVQSEIYRKFERECEKYLKNYKLMINEAINLKCTFILGDKRKRDLTNLENAIADILVKYGVLKDDNYNIIAGWDGSRCYYVKGKNKIIIEITKIRE